MHAMTSWFIRNPVAANLVMVLILIWGAISLWGIRIEGFPRIPPDSVSVSIIYPGATATQVDASITSRIEQAVTGVPGSKRITSYASDSYGEVTIQAKPTYSLSRLTEEVRTRVESISNLPSGAEKPQVQRVEFDFPAMIVQIYGDTDQLTLQKLGRQLKNELLSRSEISQIKSWGEQQITLSVMPDADRLEALGISYHALSDRIQNASLVYRTGEVRVAGARFELRADERFDAEEQLRHIVVHQDQNGGEILLKDIATIKRGFQDQNFEVLFQGKPTLGYEIQIGVSDNIIDVRNAVERVLDQQRALLPEGVEVEVWADQSAYISERLSLLRTNAVQGLLIVLVLLSVFLSPKLAFWVSLGIPISLAGAVGMMRLGWFDYSLNDVTTFGMIIALGILVDDAIVVSESVYEERSKNSANPLEATARGVHKVALATIFGVMTTIAAFSPLLSITDPLGKVLAGFAVVVIFALLFSLFESKFILPAHLAHMKIGGGDRQNIITRFWSSLQNGVANGLNFTRDKLYDPVLKGALRFRYGVVLVFIAIAVGVIGLMAKGAIRTTFFPDIPGSYVSIAVDMERGVPYPMTVNAARELQASYERANAFFSERDPMMGEPGVKLMTGVFGAASIQIYAELAPEKERSVKTLEFLNKWRAETGKIEGVDSLQFSATDNIGGGFAIELTATDSDVLKYAAERLAADLKRLEGVSQIRDDLVEGRPQIKLKLNENGKVLGLTTADLAMLVGNEFGALEVDRFLRDGEEVKLLLYRPLSARNSLSDLHSAKVQIPNGHFVPLSAVADFESTQVVEEVRRRNLKRSVLVYAKLDKSVVSAPQAINAIADTIKELEEQWPGLSVRGVGEIEQEGDMGRGLSKAFLIAMVLMYVCLAIPLKSYFQPAVIMAVIPFGVVGAALGHVIIGIPLSMLSFFGIVALSGIVVNDSLVLMTRYNDLREEGVPAFEAVHQAAKSRMRAVFLTTITTVSGLAPIMLETSEQAQYLIPAAVSLAFGEIFATAITLILVPLLCAILWELNPKNKQVRQKETESDHVTAPSAQEA